ncbi:hypothetical protein HD553DRAFT_302524 [Filobasidium floriforme]|uniref:uncharacterized protein n=1 Tax=Filobasidium floriforme TaxID=5210 RepID=UPI001E8EDE94|nr:uncharacterized protein HD553DRAFT_302524 [Filobasidium floriforme]KAH8090479.1 hypothetical protein HD553DRAFT_302524 [Filobasidium floriforme]
MSFGRPPTIGDTFKLTPPQRGSFPLDHDGECKEVMKAYLKCLKENASNNGKCRALSKDYLECRMSNNLMERDDFHNLGLGNIGPGGTATPSSSPLANAGAATTNTQTPSSSSTATSRGSLR